jgi:hypothetical protein
MHFWVCKFPRPTCTPPFYYYVIIFANIFLFISNLGCSLSMFNRLKVQPNRYLSDISSSSEGSLGQTDGNANSSSIFDTRTTTRGEKVRRKFCRRMEFFLSKGGSCSYDDERIG